jgi:hypothetical protein
MTARRSRPLSMPNSTPARNVLSLALAGVAVLLGGCASIFNGGNRTLTINSDPPGAKATFSKLEGDVVTVKTTPCTVSLDPRRGYFKGQTYVLHLELAGYHAVDINLEPTLSAWYFGNIVLGGLIGMVAVDPVTGSMWNIEPSKIELKLTPTQASMLRNKTGFVVVLASELTPGERRAMTKLN